MSDDTKETPQPLTADPSRQATGLFKGVDYQVWLTVLAWIDLNEDEILVVEGAEDFDIVTKTAGLTVQAKAIGSPISLRSESVLAGMRHYWEHRLANPSKTIRFRFVTTASSSVEASAPFGEGMSGLELWNRCATTRSVALADQIRRFLLDDPSTLKQLSALSQLMEFLKTSSAEVILADFVSPIIWDLDGAGIETVREAVRIRLHAHGEAKSLSIQDSDRATAPLFEYIAHKAFQEKRVITREEFRLVFDHSTRESVPKGELAALRMAAAQVSGGISALSFAGSWMVDVDIPPPPLPLPCCQRTALATELALKLSQQRFIAFSGSTGTGKSTLAKLVAARADQKWVWIYCNGRDATYMDYRFRSLAQQQAVSKAPLSIVFDSFDFSGGDFQRLCRPLAATILLILRAGGCVILTSKRALPEIFRREVSVPDHAFTVVPSLNEEEIFDLCASANCVHAIQRRLWSRIILFQTQGHPQLVHARVSVAARRSWPPVDGSDLLQTPEDIREERTLARELLREIDDGQRELLFRLSITSRSFRRDHALAIAESNPRIQDPGIAFDALVGPWIERRGSIYYSLSPLLTGAAEANWSAERVRRLRIEYGRVLLRSGNVTLGDAGESLFQAILAQDDQLAGPILAKFMMAPKKHFLALAAEMDWLLIFTGVKAVFPRNAFVNLILRQLQFRFAVATDHDQATKLAELLNAESRKSINPKIDDLGRGSVTVEILSSFNVPVRAATLLDCWLDANQLRKSSPQFKKFTGIFEKNRFARLGLGGLDFSDITFGFMLARKGGIGFLRDFISAVDALGSQDKKKVWAAMRQNRMRLQLFIDNVWNIELDKETRAWQDVLDALNAARNAGSKWRVLELIAAAARAIAVVQDEYLNRPEDALVTLNTARDDIGADALMLRFQRGRIFFRQKRYEEAYNMWASTLDDWPVGEFEGLLQSLVAHSCCGAAAGMRGQWREAAQALLRGSEVARQHRREFESTTFRVDAAYAQWGEGNRLGAITEFSRCLMELEKFNTARKPKNGLHTLWKLTEQIIAWCAQDAGSLTFRNIPTPRPGACSELREESEHAALEKYARSPLTWLWYTLAEAEFAADLHATTFQTLLSRPDVERFPGVQSLVSYLKLRWAFRNRRLNDLVEIIEEAARATAITKRTATVENPTAVFAAMELSMDSAGWTAAVAAWAPEVFSSALLVLIAHEQDVSAAVDQWSINAEHAKSQFDFRPLLDQAQEILRADPNSAYRLYRSEGCSRFQRVVSALRMGSDTQSSLGACYVGLLSLVTDEGLIGGSLETQKSLGVLVKRVWSDRLRFPAEFNSPRITVPAIKAQCESEYQGLQLAARILLAAEAAVSVRQLGRSLVQLRMLAGGSNDSTITTQGLGSS